MMNKQCPQCGSFNDEHADECYYCHTVFPGAKKHAPNKKKEAPPRSTFASPPPHMKIGERPRPGCVSVLATLFFAASIYLLMSAICRFSVLNPDFMATMTQSVLYFFFDLATRLLSPLQNQLMTWTGKNEIGVVVVLFAVGGLALFIGWGLWNTTRWARVLFMILLGAMAIGSFIYIIPGMLFSGVTIPDALLYLPAPVLSIIPILSVVLVVSASIYPFFWFASNGKYFRH
jgi:hypothetical protein